MNKRGYVIFIILIISIILSLLFNFSNVIGQQSKQKELILLQSGAGGGNVPIPSGVLNGDTRTNKYRCGEHFTDNGVTPEVRSYTHHALGVHHPDHIMAYADQLIITKVEAYPRNLCGKTYKYSLKYHMPEHTAVGVNNQPIDISAGWFVTDDYVIRFDKLDDKKTGYTLTTSSTPGEPGTNNDNGKPSPIRFCEFYCADKVSFTKPETPTVYIGSRIWPFSYPPLSIEDKAYDNSNLLNANPFTQSSTQGLIFNLPTSQSQIPQGGLNVPKLPSATQWNYRAVQK